MESTAQSISTPMSSKNSAEINLGFPIYGLRFINSKTLLAVGGGGEGSNGIPNKITAIKCHFNASDKDRRLQKFREITLPSNEDSPMCTAVARVTGDDHVRYSIFVGCNQSTQLVKSMSINNNLRKYLFTDEEHLRFLDAVQYDSNVLPESVGEYPKIIHLTPDNSVGALMTSKVPSEIFIFDPESLALILQFKPTVAGEVKDFHLSTHDEGKTLVYVTASVIEAVNSSTGTVISTSTKAPKATNSKLAKYFLSKVRFVGESKVVVTAALRSGKGAAIFEYDLVKQKITKERTISLSMKGVVAIDLSAATGVIACAGNDFSVTLIRMSDLKVIKRFPNLHKFAITSLSFAPNGKRLATGSASNTLNVVNIPAKIGGGSLLGSLFQYLFLTVLVAGLAIFFQNAKDTGDLDHYIEWSKKYGGEALVQAQYYGHHYGKIGLAASRKYGDEYFRKAKHYGKIGYEIAKEKSLEGYVALKDKLNKEESVRSWTDEVDAHTEIASTLKDIVSEVTRDVADATAGHENEDLETASIMSSAIGHTVISSYKTELLQSSVETSAVPEEEESNPIQDSPVEAVESAVESLGEKIASAVVPVASSIIDGLKSHSHEPVSVADTQVESSEILEKPDNGVPEELPSHEAHATGAKNEAGTIDEATSNDQVIDEVVEKVVSVEPIESAPADAPVDVSSAQPEEDEEVVAETRKGSDHVQEEVSESVHPISEEPVEEIPSAEPVAEFKADDVSGVLQAEEDRAESREPEVAEPKADSKVELAKEEVTEPDVEPKIVEPVIEPKVEPKVVEPVIEPKSEPKVVELESKAEPTTEPIEPVVKSKVSKLGKPVESSGAIYKSEDILDAKPIRHVDEVIEPQVIDSSAKPSAKASAEPSGPAEPIAALNAQPIKPVKSAEPEPVKSFEPETVEPVTPAEPEPVAPVKEVAENESIEPKLNADIDDAEPIRVDEAVVEPEVPNDASAVADSGTPAAAESLSASKKESFVKDSPHAAHDEL